jgi:leader peptidase (prepilin peptidase)/N-methyltransferase
MIEIYGIIVFLLGLIIGSFLNVVIYRLNTGRGLNGRSMCFTCGKTLNWHELVPLVSFFVQRGKCNGCDSKISYQYPLVESITGLVFLSIFMKAVSLSLDQVSAIWYMLFYMYTFSLLIVISVYDIKHLVISEKLVWLFNLLALISTLFIFNFNFDLKGPSLIDILSGPLMALPFYLLWLFTKGRGMGFGDVKLALGLGWLLGISQSVSAFFLSFWIGTLFIIILLVIKKGNLNRKTKIPFGPFLSIATFLVFLFSINFGKLLSLFS